MKIRLNRFGRSFPIFLLPFFVSTGIKAAELPANKATPLTELARKLMREDSVDVTEKRTVRELDSRYNQLLKKRGDIERSLKSRSLDQSARTALESEKRSIDSELGSIEAYFRNGKFSGEAISSEQIQEAVDLLANICPQNQISLRDGTISFLTMEGKKASMPGMATTIGFPWWQYASYEGRNLRLRIPFIKGEIWLRFRHPGGDLLSGSIYVSQRENPFPQAPLSDSQYLVLCIKPK